MSLFEQVNSILGINFGSGSISGAGSAISGIAPFILLILILILMGFGVWYIKKFKYTVFVHSQRADGKVVTFKTRGGFFTNPKTKVGRLRLMSDMKSFIVPPANKFIQRVGKKDIIHLYRTSAAEYIPITYKKEEKYFKIDENNDYKLVESNEFIVHPEFIKNWLSIQTSEDENKFNVAGFLERYQALIIYATGALIIIFAMIYASGMIEHGAGIAQEAVSACRGGQSVSLGLLLLRRWFK